MKTILFFILIASSIKVCAQDTNILIRQGNDYYRQSQFEMAERQYQQAIEADPKNVIAKFNLANAQQKQKKYVEAIKILDGLNANNAQQKLRSEAYYNQGVAHSKLKNLEESISAYKDALRLNPEDREARENLQKALIEQKKQQQQQKEKQKKQDPKMSQKDAEQKLKLLQQKEKDLRQRMQDQNKEQGQPQKEDW